MNGERGKTVVQKLNNLDYIIDDLEEQKDYSSSADTIVISMDERIEMFKYFINKYMNDCFDKDTMANYLFMVEFLTILHPKEFSFVVLYQLLNEKPGFEKEHNEVLRELLLHIKQFFKRRNLKPETGYLK